MSNQIVISSGAKVRSLEGVLTGTAGIVNSVPLGGANGVATLDALGKVPLSQLPASVVTYLGTWNAATNTPTLTNGVGDVGDLYICNVAGTVNFGAGPITFAVGDWVIYNGSQWQKSAGASGTVTSVAVTESGDALTITGSPITTSGTINIGFAGTGSQYIKGDGTLATFPTTIDQAKRLITEVYNSTGATLSKGTVVYINGGQGNLPTVTKAQANADNTSAQTYGVVQSDITNNNNGFVVVIGSLTDIDTQAYAVGTQLYLSGTTAGDWTSTKPSAPIHLVYVGIVVRSHPTQGVVEIRIQNGYELEELHDVAISSPVNNQGIFYNSSNDLWENKSIATALGYTPANDALVVHLAGTETITGSKIFSAAITADAGISLKEGVVPSAVGYTGLAGDADGLVVTKRIGSTAYTNLLYFNSATSNTYTFPNLTGTLALLEGTQTFSGNKTFSALTAFTFLNGTRMDYGLYLSKGSVPSAFSGSTVNLYSDSGNNNLVVRDNSNTSLLQFQAASSYTYTFPAASGSLALLESTQTFTGDKTFSGDILATNYYRVQQNATLGVAPSGYSTFGAINTKLNFGVGVAVSTQKVFQFETSGLTNNTTRVYTLPDATGTIALTSNLSSYLPLTGGTLTGALSGTSATFSGNMAIGGTTITDANMLNVIGNQSTVNIGVVLNNTNSTHARIYALQNVNGNFNIRDYTASSDRLSISSTGAATFKVNTDRNLAIKYDTNITISAQADAGGPENLRMYADTFRIYTATTAGGLTERFTISNTGAATFSSSVTANGVMSLSDDGTYGSNYKTLGFTGNTNGNHRIFAGVTDGMFICSKTGEGIFFRPNGGTTNTLAISSTGAATFSSTAADYGLSITNVQDASQGLLIRATDNDTSLYLLNLQSSNGATSQTWVDRFAVTKGGNVGIGTNNPGSLLHAYSSTTGTQVIANFAAANYGSSSSRTYIQIGTQYGDGSSRIGSINTTGNQSALVFQTQSATSGVWNDAMYINGSGNVGIGTTPSNLLDVLGGTSGSSARIKLTHATSSASIQLYTGVSDGVGIIVNNNPLWFDINGSERMRITSGGDVLVNTTSTSSGAKFNVFFSDNTNNGAVLRETTGNASVGYLIFNSNGSQTGSITRIGSTNAVAYNTTSDYRLKEDFKEINGLEKISAIKVYDFKWKDNEARMDGVIAHELQEILPYAVYGKKDALEKDGSIKAQAVDYSKLVPVLVKAIQELKAEIDELKNK